MGVDTGSLSRLLSGDRKPQPGELTHIAEYVGASLADVYREFKVPMPRKELIFLEGHVDEFGAVTMRRPDAKIEDVKVEPPPGLENGVAIRIDINRHLMNGWLLFVQPAVGIASEAVGRLCIVKAEGRIVLRVLDESAVRGRFNLTPWAGLGSEIRAVEAENAAPVAWIRCL